MPSHEEDRVRDAEQHPAKGQVGEGAGNAGGDREGAVGESDPGQHRADPERRDDGVYSDFGHERAVDQAKATPTASAAAMLSQIGNP